MRSVAGHYGTLPSTKTMGNISEHTMTHSIPTSPSHGSLALYSTFSPPRQQVAPNPNSPHSEVSSPVYRGDGTLDHRHKAHLAKVAGIAPDVVISKHFWSHFCVKWHRATELPVFRVCAQGSIFFAMEKMLFVDKKKDLLTLNVYL